MLIAIPLNCFSKKIRGRRVVSSASYTRAWWEMENEKIKIKEEREKSEIIHMEIAM